MVIAQISRGLAYALWTVGCRIGGAVPKLSLAEVLRERHEADLEGRNAGQTECDGRACVCVLTLALTMA